MPITHPLCLASGNAGKIRELESMLNDLGITIRAQTELGVVEVPEAGTTFVENAIIKARNASLCTGLPTLADDSGLEVDALNGAPGIYSARYAGQGANDKLNVEKLLNALSAVPDEKRTARFQCVIVLLRHAQDPTPMICQGTWEGLITRSASGRGGFGYDPVFYVPDEGCTAAQLSAERKNQLSHRGQALAQLRVKLQHHIAPT
jgi:XTP/dITP diphosphohydrolase